MNKYKHKTVFKLRKTWQCFGQPLYLLYNMKNTQPATNATQALCPDTRDYTNDCIKIILVKLAGTLYTS